MAFLGLLLFAVIRDAPSKGGASRGSDTPVAQPTRYDYIEASVLGDSYSLGVDPGSADVWARKLASQLCWNLNLQGEPGTGYINSGTGAGTRRFAGRVVEVVKSDPDLLIVQGGNSDVGKADVQRQAAHTLTELKTQAPDAQIVAVGPILAPGQSEAHVKQLRDAIRSGAAATGVPFIDPIDLRWIPDGSFYTADELHLNREGNELYAKGLRSALVNRGLMIRDACKPNIDWEDASDG
ncbi:hypothetical protein W823_14770 [Williamsia sp. D3]|nr:hypothetical protein W823_14770 [Williamsia sp. D3]